MSRDDTYVKDILVMIGEIEDFTKNLSYEYAAVNATTVWDTLQDDIPKLKAVLQKEMN